MSRILDAMDELAKARDMVRLIQMAVDGKSKASSARATGCEVALSILDEVTAMLRQIRTDAPQRNADVIPETPAGRAAFIAETLDLDPPARITGDDGAPSVELLTFCRDTGASLDFIYLADVRPMLRRDFHATREGAAA